MATNAQSSDYVTVATFVVKDEGLESLPEGRESSESIENVVTNDHDPGTVQVSYFDAEEAAEVITSGDYDEANHEAEMQEEDGSQKPWRKGGSTTLWSLPAVRALLDIYEEHEQEYVNKTVRRRVFWEIVAEKMKERGFDYDWCSCRVRFKGMCRKVLSLAMHGRSKLTRRLWWEERVERIMETLDQEFVRMRQARRRTISDTSAASTSFGGGMAFQIPTQVSQVNVSEAAVGGDRDAFQLDSGMQSSTGEHQNKKRRLLLKSQAPKEDCAPAWFHEYVNRRERQWERRLALEEQRHNQIVQLLTQKNELLGKLTGILEKMGSQTNFVKIAPKPPAVIANPIRARRIVSSNGTTMFVPIAPSASNKDSTPQEESQKGST
ncbi:uncharacterized protein LOC134787719 [Penaeus indicus]|uniref:uncharacterized protein LOC134787719 n=1 Tax=Penaeus indicus TaxID=29960 RepID=UPI00300CDAAF